MTDKQKIRKWFKTRKYLTCYDATFKLGVMNARSRISEMSDVIRDCMVDVVKADGTPTQVARYRLI
jgi:hypothetical protein